MKSNPKPNTKKFKDWCKYFLDPESETYGNKTKSAMKAYKSKLYTTAGQIGWENYKKLEYHWIELINNLR